MNLRWPTGRAMPIAYLVAVALALFVWQIDVVEVAAPSPRGPCECWACHRLRAAQTIANDAAS